MEEFTFFIPGRLPSLNEAIDSARTHWAKSAKEKKYWTKFVANMVGSCPCYERVFIEFVWISIDKRTDPDNICGWARKVILDGLILAHLIKNDGHAQIAGFRDDFIFDKKKPGCVVTVTEVN